MEKEQVVEYLKSNDGFLEENGFVTEKQVEVEKEIPLTEDNVNKFIGENQGFRDKYNQGIEREFLKRKTGVEDVTPEMLGKKLIFEEKINEYKDIAINERLSSNPNSKLILSQLDRNKVSFEDGKLNGLDGQLDEVKKAYPMLFDSKVTTPPVPKGKSFESITYKEFEAMSKAERKQVSEEDLKRIMSE